ncbi:MAG: co-chaperone DjlA [Sinobacteraceae bacterium]|nr:co-chaperone DjlA [Nevskiaceae bacterium]MBV9316906.1 co-chaperone DjlA [Gammaproteobacteria bacterium]
MKWIGKVTGGLLGGLVLGPIGAALGALLGHQFDESDAQDETPPAAELASIGERFFRASFQVMGYLAKADGRVSEREIAAARSIMQQLRLDATQVAEAIACFTAGKQPAYDYGAELAQLAAVCRGRPDIARVFLEIQVRAALEGNDLEGPVRPLIARLAAALDVSTLEVMHIEAVLRIQRAGGFGGARAADAASAERELAEAYRVLETTAAASDAEVAKAYRRQLHRHHPDKLKAHGLPESMLAHAKQRTQQIIEAWEIVRERRRIR